MLFKFETGAVYLAMERFIDEFKDRVEVVGFSDYDHVFSHYETLTRSIVKPEYILLDHSECVLLEEYL